jgi:hypothetical protein
MTWNPSEDAEEAMLESGLSVIMLIGDGSRRSEILTLRSAFTSMDTQILGDEAFTE